jgi:hypothetical protein
MCLREKIGPDPRNFNQRVSLGRNDLLIRTFLSEDDLEQQCLQWFAEQDWEVLHGPDIAPDGDNPLRASFHDVFAPGYAGAVANHQSPSPCFRAGRSDTAYRPCPKPGSGRQQ